MPHFLLSATHKSSGKTTISIGICALLKRRGREVQAFKKGPDYIDPLWLTTATGRPCHNLDFHTQSDSEITAYFSRLSAHTDLSIIEGNMGLFDSIDVEGAGSNAALSVLLKAPVILILNVQGTTRSVIPMLMGYQAFEKNVNIAGVILNRVAGKRHEQRLRDVITHYTDIPIVGAIHRNPALSIDEEHLGLVPSNESAESHEKVEQIADILENHLDLDLIERIAAQGQMPPSAVSSVADSDASSIRIGIPRDEAFAFYYSEDLEALSNSGAELVFFDSLRDTQLPDVEGLFIGGGFPERHMESLSANVTLRQQIKDVINDNMPVYAECGGLMYLSRSLIWNGVQAPMVGIIPTDITMFKHPIGRGYIQLKETTNHPWGIGSKKSTTEGFPAHEFHYSKPGPIDGTSLYAYEVLRGSGIDGQHDGYLYKNLLASYAHLRDVEGNRWAKRFVEFIRLNRR